MLEYGCNRYVCKNASIHNQYDQEEEHTMAYRITDNCVKCGTCADTCPLGIISEGEDKYVIDAEQCVECGSCAAACPVEAIEL